MIKKIIVTLICILALPILVNADMGMPETYHYEVIMTNPNGVELEQYDGTKVTIPYDTKLTVHFEYEKDGELYLDVEYNGAYGTINSKDVKIYSEEIDFDYFSKNEYGVQLYTVDNVEMYKGPSTMYGKAGKIIPKGVVLEYDYSDSMWAYVEYEGTKGWVFIFQYTDFSETALPCNVVNVAEEGQKLLVLKDGITIYADRLRTNIAGKLEAGEYDIKYNTATFIKNRGYYVESEQLSGWVYLYIDSEELGIPKVDEAVLRNRSKVMHTSLTPLPLYKNLYDQEPTNITIDKYTLLDAQYSVTTEMIKADEDNWDFVFNQAYQVVYNNELYWIKGTNELFLVSYSKGIYTLSKDLTIYKEINSTESVTTIKSGEKVEVHMSNYLDEALWYYVEYGDYKGWINSGNLEYSNVEYESYDENMIIQETPEQPTEPEEPVAKKKLSGLQIGLICGGAAIIATLTAIVSIILVNKKKKNKKEETVVEAAPVVTTTEEDNKIKVPSTTGVLPVVKEEDPKNEE